MATLEQVQSLWNQEVINYRKLLIQKGNSRHLVVFDRWVKLISHPVASKSVIDLSNYFRKEGLLGITGEFPFTSQKDAAPAELLVEFDRIVAESKEMIAACEANQQPMTFNQWIWFIGLTVGMAYGFVRLFDYFIN